MQYRFIVLFLLACSANVLPSMAQSGRLRDYSESQSKAAETDERVVVGRASSPERSDVVRVETDLVTVPVRLLTRSGKAVSGVTKNEFKIFENGVEQDVAYFSDENQPFTVALLLDMSYSSVFKLKQIQAAATAFVRQLRENDRVTVIAFDERVNVLCKPTNDRRILQLAIDGARIGSGTSLYKALDDVFTETFKQTPGRKAIVLLSDGVDTSSEEVTSADVARRLDAQDVIIYPIQYNTFTDVQKSRRQDAEVRYDEDDRPYAVEAPPGKGQRESDYAMASVFLNGIAESSGGRVLRVSSTTDLDKALAAIADELRKIYSLGYYPREERKPGVKYHVKVRVYRPDLIVRARASYSK
jgi:VWFA-related protein